MPEYFDNFTGITATTDYHPETALSLAIACDLAYKDRTPVIQTANAWGYPNVDFIEVKKGLDIDTQCFVMGDQKNIVVVFRGSYELKDWFSNFQAVRNPGPLTSNSKAHEGFQNALFPAVIKLTELIDTFRTANQKIWITGHSLGGALCSLFAGMLIENGYDVYGIYTYASPRPGDDVFASALDQKIAGPHYRVVNTGDIVPHIPPEPFFSHSGKRIILTSQERENSEESWFSQRIDALKVFVNTTAHMLDVVDNHRLTADLESYIPRLLKDIERNQTKIMPVEVIKADYTHPAHAQDIVTLMSDYACDPMGGGEPLSDHVKTNLAATLATVPHAFTLLCYIDNQPAGLVNCLEGFSTFKCAPLINIHDMSISKPFRGQGLAKKLLSAVEAEAQTRGCCKITLEVLEENTIARNAYSRFGFEPYRLDDTAGSAQFWQKSL